MITLTRIPDRADKDRRIDRVRKDFRALRIAAGIKQYTAADAIGVSAAAISRWERGEPCLSRTKSRHVATWLADQIEADRAILAPLALRVAEILEAR